MLHPCCGLDLEKAAKAVAVFDIILSVIELVAAMIFESEPLSTLTTDVDDPYSRDINYIVTITLLFGIVLVIVKIVQLCVSILLLYGVIEKNYKKCEIWVIFCCVLVTLAVLHILFETTLRERLVENPSPLYMRLALPILEILLNWYLMWVVFAFMLQLKRNQTARTACCDAMIINKA